MENYSTSFLGAGSNLDIKFVLIYNSQVFSRYSESLMINNRPLAERPDLLEKLSSDPSKGNIVEQVSLVLQLVENQEPAFKIIPYSPQLTLDQESGNKIVSDGFNRIIYLSLDKNIIGYTKFNSTQGTSTTNLNSKSYQVKKDYRTSKISLIIDVVNNIITRRDDSALDKVDNIDHVRLLGRNNWQYTNSSDFPNISTLSSPTYSSNLNELLSHTPVSHLLTSSGVSEIKGLGRISTSHLSVSKQVALDSLSESAGFKHCQVGFWKGDLAMYLWSDELDGVIKFEAMSLTKRSSASDSPYMYTRPVRGITPSHIHELPPYYSNMDNKMGIVKKHLVGFSGTYIYLYLPSQKKTVIFDIVSNRYLPGGVIANLGDPKNKVVWSDSTQIVSYTEAIRTIPHLVNIRLDIKRYLFDNFLRIVAKVGEWIILDHPSQDSYIFSNYTKTVMIRKDEYYNAHILNNDCLLVRDGGSYQLFLDPGDYTTKKLSAAPGRVKTPYVLDIGVNDSPMLIQKTFLSYFRRNALPRSMRDFKIIAAYGGIIFYSTYSSLGGKKYINYL